MRRWEKLILAAAIALLLVPAAALATEDFKTFVAALTSATLPLGSGDRVVVGQSGITKYVQGNLFVDTTSAQTLSSKTINGASNTLTVLAPTQLSGLVPAANGGTPGLPTSGGILCGTSGTVEAWSTAPAANTPMIWGGPGACPAAGSFSGNTTQSISTTGSHPLGQGGSWDASGNWIANANATFTNVVQTWTAQQNFAAVVASQNNQTTGTSYTLATSDCGKTIYVTVGGGFVITMPNSLPVGCTIAIEQAGVGQVTPRDGSGNACTAPPTVAVCNSAHGFTKTFGQAAVIGLYVDTNSGGAAAHYIFTGDGA